MEKRIKFYNRLAIIIVFIALPLLFYALGDFPRRSFLKEIIAVITVLAFFTMLLQFYLSRLNRNVLKNHKMSKVIHWHKVLGYVFVSVLMLHPVLIVFPRFFESGVEPIGAFTSLLTNYTNTGILLGIIAWLLMILIGITAMFRSYLGIRYKAWRYLHGLISLVFIILASTHVISLGRHINRPMALIIILLASGAVVILIKTYFIKPKKTVQ